MMWERIREVITVTLLTAASPWQMNRPNSAHAEGTGSVTRKADANFTFRAVFFKASWLKGSNHAPLNSRLLEELGSLR